MPVTKSAKKRLNTNKKKRGYNIKCKNKVMSSLKRCRQAIASKRLDEAREMLSTSMAILDKAASKGVMHRKTASRKKSHIARKVNQLQEIAEKSSNL